MKVLFTIGLLIISTSTTSTKLIQNNIFQGNKSVSLEGFHNHVLKQNNLTQCNDLEDFLRSSIDVESNDDKSSSGRRESTTSSSHITEQFYLQHENQLKEIVKACSEVIKIQKNRFSWKTWFYGSVFVLLISLVSMTGALVIPFMNAKVYHYVLSFLVALAVGSLSGSSIFHLIPQAFNLVEVDGPSSDSEHDYLNKGAMVLSGIYLFFITERVLKSLMVWRQRRHKRHNCGGGGAGSAEHHIDQQHNHHLPPICSVKAKTYHSEDFHLFEAPRYQYQQQISSNTNNTTLTPLSITPADSSVDVGFVPDCEGANGHVDMLGVKLKLFPISESESSSDGVAADNNTGGAATATVFNKEEHHSEKQHRDIMSHQHNKPYPVTGHCNHVHSVDTTRPIATVAWMVIFGDGIHNFIDGLAIGAAFVTSMVAGLSTSVAVICEELPHELGDFAILLNAGMTWKQAMFYNFLSALSCFVGMAIGILLGELAQASQYIFGLAGGMFLYISLVDMMPEMAEAAMTRPTNTPFPQTDGSSTRKDQDDQTVDNQYKYEHVEVGDGGTGAIWGDGRDVKAAVPSLEMVVLQSCGILIGWILMYVFAKYGSLITFPDISL